MHTQTRRAAAKKYPRSIKWDADVPVYLGHTRKGAWRIDLDGKPAGAVTADEEAHAKATLASIQAKKEARTIAAPPAKRLSLADLKAAALARKSGAQREVSQQEINHAQNATSRRCNRRPEAR